MSFAFALVVSSRNDPETREKDIHNDRQRYLPYISGSMLESVNLSFTDVAQSTCYLSDMSMMAEFNEVYKKYFVDKPSRICLAAKGLAHDVLCKITCVAYGGK